MTQLDNFSRAYIEAALWSSTDDTGEPLDSGNAELSESAKERMVADCAKFQGDYVAKLNALDYCSGDFPETQVAHDFWLTRNRHGAGFWDGDYPKEIGDVLTELAHSYGECDLYVGDDGLIYVA